VRTFAISEVVCFRKHPVAACQAAGFAAGLSCYAIAVGNLHFCRRHGAVENQSRVRLCGLVRLEVRGIPASEDYRNIRSDGIVLYLFLTLYASECCLLYTPVLTVTL